MSRHRRLYRRQDSPYWWCVFYDARNVRHRENTRCTDRRAAEAYLQRRERETQDPAHSNRNKTKTVTSAIDDFLASLPGTSRAKNTIRMYEHRGSQVARVLGDHDVYVLRKEDVLTYVKRRSEEGASSHTIYKELVTLRQTLKHQEIEPAGIIPRFKSGYIPTKRWLSRTEYRALQMRLEPARQLWVTGAVLMGGRKDEIEKTTWADLNWETWEIHVRGTKTPGSDRFVPLTEPLARVIFAHALRTFHPKLPTGPVFGKWTKACRDLKGACEKAGILYANPTALRHTYGSWLVQQGVSISVVAKLMGNSVAMVEKVYGHLDRETFRRAGQRLVEYHQDQPPASKSTAETPASSVTEAAESDVGRPKSRFELIEID